MTTVLVILAIHSILFMMLYARISDGFRGLRGSLRQTQELLDDVIAKHKR